MAAEPRAAPGIALLLAAASVSVELACVLQLPTAVSAARQRHIFPLAQVSSRFLPPPTSCPPVARLPAPQDIVGYTTMSKCLEPECVMTLLHDLFCRYDMQLGAHAVYKVETIGGEMGHTRYTRGGVGAAWGGELWQGQAIDRRGLQ